MDCEHGFKSLRLGGNCPWCDLAALRAKLEAFKTGGCPCKLSKSWDGESHHNTCPEIRDELERGYCDRIKELTAALREVRLMLLAMLQTAFRPSDTSKDKEWHKYLEAHGNGIRDYIAGVLSPAPRPEDEKVCKNDYILCDGESCPKCKPSDEKPKEDK